MNYRYRRQSKPTVRTIVAKYAGQCACCGADIRAGEMVDYYPVGTIASRTTPAIAHRGGLDGNSPRCSAELRRKNEAPDPGELAADQWAAEHCSSDNT
jgi:hypothetical protein